MNWTTMNIYEIKRMIENEAPKGPNNNNQSDKDKDL